MNAGGKPVVGSPRPPIVVFGRGVSILLGVLVFSVARSVLASETTLYVNQHFEVRDRDQPTKYVFNGATRVARITGSLSTNTRIQRLRLQPGWNLCSVAVGGSLLPRGGAGEQSGAVTAAYRWNQTGWVSVSTNEVLAAGTVLWLHASTNSTLALTGTYSDPTNRVIQAGGYFQPGSGLEALPLPGVAGLDLWHHDAASQTWEIRAPAIPTSDPLMPELLAPGEALFVRTAVPAELEIPAPVLRVRFYHQDHLGSSSVMTDAAGALVEEIAFYPFGVARHEHQPRQLEEEYTFTQKERDSESGLQYFGKRFYAPGLGKWLSTDPMEEKGGSLNLYAYANQNPLKYHDPDGAAIDVKTETAKGETTHTITLTAVIQDSPAVNADKPRTPAELEAFRTALVDTIKQEYSHYDKASKTRWVADPKIRILGPDEKPGPNDHVFQLVGAYKMSGIGQTRSEMQPDGSKHRGMVMKVQVRALLDAHNAELRASPHYKSPESIAAHEFGHAAGLDDLETDHENLMSHGREHDKRVIKMEQLKTIVREFNKGHLNKHLE